ncbi:MAG: hypothetical protein ACKVX7_18095 [Planctomycetota bacterium]
MIAYDPVMANPRSLAASAQPDGSARSAESDDLAARSKQLARELLVAMDAPTSVEREEYEAHKERADQIAFEQFYLATGQLTEEQTTERGLRKLADRIEQRNPAGDNEPIEVQFALAPRPAKLRCAQTPSRADRHDVELTIQSESAQSTSSQWLRSGSNAELVAWLRTPATIAETLAIANELALNLKPHRLA